MTQKTQKVTDLVKNLVKLLTPSYKDERIAYNNAWDLLEYLTNQDRSVLLAHEEYTLSEEQHKKLDTWVKQIAQDAKPIQYILGTVPFLDLTIHIEPPILIPRPETEEWTARLLVQLKENNIENLTILDLCTGSGCIALALAQALPKSMVYATDISDKALKLARKNAQKNHINNITFISSDVYDAVPNMQCDLIVSNPPYITTEEFEKMDKTVTEWEDQQALVTNDEGLKIIKKIVAKADNYLQQSSIDIPQLWIEIGYRQASTVTKILEQSGFKATVYKDLYGNDRVVVGTLKKTM